MLAGRDHGGLVHLGKVKIPVEIALEGHIQNISLPGQFLPISGRFCAATGATAPKPTGLSMARLAQDQGCPNLSKKSSSDLGVKSYKVVFNWDKGLVKCYVHLMHT